MLLRAYINRRPCSPNLRAQIALAVQVHVGEAFVGVAGRKSSGGSNATGRRVLFMKIGCRVCRINYHIRISKSCRTDSSS